MRYARVVNVEGGAPLDAQALLDLPRYSIPEAAGYVRMSAETLRSWVAGRKYPVKSGVRAWPPILTRPRHADPRLSYANLVEAYVLNVLRSLFKVKMQEIKRGIELVEKKYGIPRFLLSPQLRAREGSLLLEQLGRIVNVGRGGQEEIPDAVRAYLRRIEWSEEGLPFGLYPVTRPDHPAGPRRVVILPNVGFGRPVTERRNIATATIVDRFAAGESITDLAEDYDLEPLDIEEAIRAEAPKLAA